MRVPTPPPPPKLTVPHVSLSRLTSNLLLVCTDYALAYNYSLLPLTFPVHQNGGSSPGGKSRGEREGERERDRETDRQTDIDRGRGERYIDREEEWRRERWRGGERQGDI